jgi:hypothetical protein
LELFGLIELTTEFGFKYYGLDCRFPQHVAGTNVKIIVGIYASCLQDTVQKLKNKMVTTFILLLDINATMLIPS